jgi:hypothetical protein
MFARLADKVDQVLEGIAKMIRPAAFFSSVFLLALASLAQTSANSSTPARANLPVLNLPANTVLLAELSADIDLRQSKPGDLIQALTTEDLTRGKALLLQKGSVVTGRVAFFEPVSPGQPDNILGIQFDRVKAKNGSEQSLHLIVRALAPHAQPASNPTPGLPHPVDAGIEALSPSKCWSVECPRPAFGSATVRERTADDRSGLDKGGCETTEGFATCDAGR